MTIPDWSVPHLAVRRADHDVPEFVRTIVALITSQPPHVIDLPHAEHGNEIHIRPTRTGGTP